MANIYIVEDDTNIQEIEAIALKNSGHSVEQFDDAAHFYKKLEETLPDLAILDLMLPDEDGYEMVKGLDIGADDYIKKPFSIIEFITRVKAVLRRTLEQPDDKYMTIGEIFLDNERHVVYVDNKGIELTYKEYELLKLLMHNAGIVLTREKIMERVWDTEFEGESRTVDMHIKTLRKKLGDSSRHIKTVRNVGYVME